jgi:HEAT repeat protein
MGPSRTAIAIPLLLLLEAAVFGAAACTCSPPPEPLAALAKADAVFSGTAVGRRDPQEGAEIHSSMDPIDYVFATTRVWKGDFGDTVVVRTARSSASCGYSFVLGEEYLVYASRRRDDPELLGTSLCTRTRPVGRAVEDLRAFEGYDTSGDAEELERRIVESIIRRLSSGDQHARAEAAKALGQMGREPELSLGALSELYGRGTVEDRRSVVSAVHWINAFTKRSDLIIPVLLSALNDTDASVQSTAIFALSRVKGDPDGVLPALIGELDDEHPSVRATALKAIGDMARADLDAAAALPALERLLEDEDPRVRGAALGALADVAEDTVAVGPILDAVAGDWSEDVRTTATWALGRLDVKTADVVEVLVCALDDHSPKVRKGALMQLSQMGACGAEAVRSIWAALSDPDEGVRRDAVMAMGSLAREVPEAYACLREALKHPFVDVRAEVPFRLTLAEFDSSEVLEALEGALADTSEEVRLSVVRALGKLGENEPAGVTQLVVAAAEDASPRVRRGVASVLSRDWVPQDESRPLLDRLVRDDDQWVREAADRALARIRRR